MKHPTFGQLWVEINSFAIDQVSSDRRILFKFLIAENSPLRSPFYLRTPPSDDGLPEGDREKSAIESLSIKIFNHLCDEIIIETTFFNIAEILEKKIENKNMVSLLHLSVVSKFFSGYDYF